MSDDLFDPAKMLEGHRAKVAAARVAEENRREQQRREERVAYARAQLWEHTGGDSLDAVAAAPASAPEYLATLASLFTGYVTALKDANPGLRLEDPAPGPDAERWGQGVARRAFSGNEGGVRELLEKAWDEPLLARSVIAYLRTWPPERPRDPQPLVALAEPEATQQETVGEDESAYRPAKEFYGDGKPIADIKKLHKVLKENKWIRSCKPNPQRLRIHAGDMHKYLSQPKQAADPLDLPSEVVDAAVRAVEQRKAEERARKEAGK